MVRKMMGAVLGLWLALMSWAPVLADGMVLPLDQPGYPAVRYHRVQVEIDTLHATTRVEQEFYNPYDYAVTGRYLFPIPPEAALTRFRVEVDGKEQTPVRQDAAATNAAIYESVQLQHDPSLLQFVDWETLALDIELAAGASKKMTLEYEQVLAPTGGLCRYRYVLGTERYSALPLEEVSVVVQLRSPEGIGALYPASHAATVTPLGEEGAEVRWTAKNVNPTEDFELFFAPAKEGFGSGLLTGQRQGQEHFLFVFAPELAAADEVALPKDIVFVLDRSGSMSGEKIAQAQSAMQFILGQLGDTDRFSIVGFDDQVELLSETLLPANRESREKARRFVDELTVRASTDLDLALRTGLGILQRSEPRSGATRMVVFLTDGLPTAGVVDEVQIASRAREANGRVEARLHVFGVGYDVNTHLLDGLAAENGGSVTYVQPGENLELALSSFYRQIASPVLTDLEVSFEGVTVSELSPQALPDLFRGTSLLLTGRYRAQGQQAVVRVRGQAGGKAREYRYTFELGRSGGHDFVPRLWATRRVGELLDEVRVKGETPALVEEIKGLGLGYGIVTPYTTFAVAAQAEGAASASNMTLYGNLPELNRSSGQTTIQARVQNQSYQQAAQASVAVGANIFNHGSRSLAQIGEQQVELGLLQEYQDVGTPISAEWISRNLRAERQVSFGSAEYFELAADPEARAYLQGGTDLLFNYQGQLMAVYDNEKPALPEPVSAEGGLWEQLVSWLLRLFGGR